MQTWKWLVGACAVVGAVCYGYSRCSRGPASKLAVVVHQSVCSAVHGFPTGSGSQSLVGDNCRPEGCGLNGSWLGRGVRFRTLSLRGAVNEQGLRIIRFHNGPDELTLHVEGQDLYATMQGSAQRLPPDQLLNSELLLEHLNEAGLSDATYTLTFSNVRSTPFWATGTGVPATAPLYDFEVVNNSDGCEMALCEPGLDDDYNGGFKGTAVIFGGDLYNDKTYAVSNDSNGDLINIACVGTAISKVFLLRHTTASASATHPTIPERQALLRLLTADYCGSGTPFTEDRLPLKLWFNNQDYPLSASADYNMSDATSVDAVWTADQATCIGTPRLLRSANPPNEQVLRQKIHDACIFANKNPVPDCPSIPLNPFDPLVLGNSYGISGNPASPMIN